MAARRAAAVQNTEHNSARNDHAESAAPTRILALDWSGDKTAQGQRRKIWIADWNRGELALTAGLTRDQAVDRLIAAARETPRLVAGLDFAFSFPAWFVRQQGCARAEDLWRLIAAGKGEEWLCAPNAFCWGRPGGRRPHDHRAPAWRGFRATDRAVGLGGIQPKSPFQIGGAGAVGTGSLRGIPALLRLRQAGLSIWPFDPFHLPAALEIYPRLFTGPGNKSSRSFRESHLAQRLYQGVAQEILTKATSSEDAFDALCSMIGMKERVEEFSILRQATNPDRLLEGQIWRPGASQDQ